MEGKTFIIVVLSGLCFLPACFPRVYFLVEKAMTWDEARSYCRSEYTDLATVSNEEELEKLIKIIKTYYKGHIWIGLYGDINSWRWSFEKENYYGQEAKFTKWRDGEPKNHLGYEKCVEILTDGEWNDRPCKKENPFVCYNEKAAPSHFIFVNEPKTWSEAQSYCRERHTDLASVRNQAENGDIKSIITSEAWIGLYRDPWKWSDGSPTSFTKWHTNKPTGNVHSPCVLLHKGKWEDRRCDDTLYFFCQLVHIKQRVVRVKVTAKDSSVNLEDAAEAILQQLRQTLKDNGLDKDMKLIWTKQPDGKVFHREEKEKGKDSK